VLINTVLLFAYNRSHRQTIVFYSSHKLLVEQEYNSISLSLQLLTMPAHYHIHGVERDSTAAKSKEAYRTLQISHHPDKTLGLAGEKRAKSATISKAANVAYEALSDTQLLASYNLALT
jgi:DnaJ-class molecular chaperone